MKVKQINALLCKGRVDVAGILPNWESLRGVRYVFRHDFGLRELPEEPGLILVRGPRQYGKSTWLEGEVKRSVKEHGPASTYYLNGDELADAQDLSNAIEEILPFYAKGTGVKRLFIDEITAVGDWAQALKRLLDRGLLRDILVVSTGSKAADLRHGSERLPGRKGKLDRNVYYFTPVSFKEFTRVTKNAFGQDAVVAYIVSGGCPLAANELAVTGTIPEHVITMVRDWISGEFARSGRPRGSLWAVMEALIRGGGNPVGQAQLARQAGLANNTIAAGYIELLGDLMAIAPCYVWDVSHHTAVRRRPCKYHFINLLAAVAWHRGHIRSVSDFKKLDPFESAKFYEWLAAQELWRRAAVRGDELPDQLCHLRVREHEIDFVLSPRKMLEVKSGTAHPLEFGWFTKAMPGAALDVINKRSFDLEKVRGLGYEEFLCQEG